MSQQGDREEFLKKLNGLINSLRIGMFTTVEEDGSLRSRPMAAQTVEGDGDLWFFTQETAPKVGEVEQRRKVNVTFSDERESHWVSVSGTGQVVRDREKMQELWKPFLKTWFPNGPDDPDIALIKVEAEHGDYWDSSSPARVLLGFAKAAITGERSQAGEGRRVEL
jgi:general stress protein 26